MSMPWRAKPAPAEFPPTKVCKRCHHEKPRDAFGVHCSMADNRDSECRACRRGRVLARRALRAQRGLR